MLEKMIECNVCEVEVVNYARENNVVHLGMSDN